MHFLIIALQRQFLLVSYRECLKSGQVWFSDIYNKSGFQILQKVRFVDALGFRQCLKSGHPMVPKPDAKINHTTFVSLDRFGEKLYKKVQASIWISNTKMWLPNWCPSRFWTSPVFEHQDFRHSLCSIQYDKANSSQS